MMNMETLNIEYSASSWLSLCPF